MDYWTETMQDDSYSIAADGWKAETYRIIETNKKGKEKDKGWTCDLIPKSLVVARYFAAEQTEIDKLAAILLGFCGNQQSLLLYRRLCRWYSTIDPAATVEYVHAYREMWDSDASAEASS